MALHYKELQKLQAMMMIKMKVNGMNNEQIADHLGIHPATVHRRLTFADKAGLFVDLEREILEDLVPKAMNAIKTALDDGDAETALEILRATGVLKDPKAPKTQTEMNEVDELAKAIGEARERKMLEENTIDAEFRTSDTRGSLAGLLEDGNPTGEETVSEDRVESESATVKTSPQAPSSN